MANEDGNAGNNVDISTIERLIDLMRRSGVMHLALEQPTYKISITRRADNAPTASVTASPTAVVSAVSVEPAPTAPAPTVVSPVVQMNSPVVGLVQSAGPERVLPKQGDRVRQGQLLAVIEAMKVPNEVRSPVEGIVSSVLVEEGSPVEFGQTLFLLLPDEGGEINENETPV